MTNRLTDIRPDDREPQYLEPFPDWQFEASPSVVRDTAPLSTAERVGKLLEPLRIKIPPYVVDTLRTDILNLIAEIEQRHAVEDSAQDAE